jgi:hypothetical protein
LAELAIKEEEKRKELKEKEAADAKRLKDQKAKKQKDDEAKKKQKGTDWKAIRDKGAEKEKGRVEATSAKIDEKDADFEKKRKEFGKKGKQDIIETNAKHAAVLKKAKMLLAGGVDMTDVTREVDGVDRSDKAGTDEVVVIEKDEEEARRIEEELHDRLVESKSDIFASFK